jgi:O-succinylbenzoate synthase
MPTLDELTKSARVVSIPMRTKFRGLVERELLVFEGPNGWSEFSAFNEYGDEEASSWLAAAIEWGYGDIPEPVRKSVSVNATLPAVSPDGIEKILTRFGDFNSVKIKVAEKNQDQSIDIERIVKTRSLYPEAKIKLDANGGYTPEQALALIERLKIEGIDLEYFEQPCSTIQELASLKLSIRDKELGCLIAADESVRRATDPLAVIEAGAADLIVMKSAPLGGITSALKIAAESGVQVIASSALQSSIGLAMELHFAATLPSLNFDSGLGTINLFGGDLTKDSLRPENGILELRRPEINLPSLDTLKAEDHRGDWWIARLERCGRILGL